MTDFFSKKLYLIPNIITLVLATAIAVNSINCVIGFEGSCINVYNFVKATSDLLIMKQ